MTGLGALVVGAVLIASLTACDAQTDPTSTASSQPSSAAASLAEARGALLARDDLPRLFGELTTLSAQDVADEAGDPTLQSQLEQGGFVGALRRDLRGRSRDISGADSRVLVFADAAGAESFLEVVADNPDPFFGGPADVRPLTVAGAEGVLIKPPMCACAGAQPIYVGLVTAGDRLLWLQITGANASAGDVRELLGGAVDASR